MSFKILWSVLKDTINGFNEANVLQLSAALAYYAMFSIGPLLVIAVGLAGFAFGDESVRNNIHAQLQGTRGEPAPSTVESMMTARKPGTSLIPTIVRIAAPL